MTSEPETIPVTFTVSAVRLTPRSGKLLALASVTIDLGDLELALHTGVFEPADALLGSFVKLALGLDRVGVRRETPATANMRSSVQARDLRRRNKLGAAGKLDCLPLGIDSGRVAVLGFHRDRIDVQNRVPAIQHVNQMLFHYAACPILIRCSVRNCTASVKEALTYRTGVTVERIPGVGRADAWPSLRHVQGGSVGSRPRAEAPPLRLPSYAATSSSSTRSGLRHANRAGGSCSKRSSIAANRRSAAFSSTAARRAEATSSQVKVGLPEGHAHLRRRMVNRLLKRGPFHEPKPGGVLPPETRPDPLDLLLRIGPAGPYAERTGKGMLRRMVTTPARPGGGMGSSHSGRSQRALHRTMSN